MNSSRLNFGLVSCALLVAQAAHAGCDTHGLFAVPSIRETLQRFRGLPPAATAVPAANAPQSLSDLHETMNDALVFALVRNKSIPGLAINANGAAVTQEFNASTLFGVPAAVTATGSQSFVRVRILSQGGTNATCYYKHAGNGYSFDYCTRTINESICNADSQICRSMLNLGINAGDTVIAHGVQVPLADCNARNCGPEAVQVSLPSVNAACEGLAQSSVHFLEDLTCTEPNHVALEMLGAGNVLHGHGHTIVSPGSEIGLFVSGDNATVRHLTIDNVSGYGLMAYDANGFQLHHNRFRQNLAGVNIYTDNANSTGVAVYENDISGNAFAGLIFSGDGMQTKNPLIQNNSFANTGGYAVAIDASAASISGTQNNIYTGSAGALYLSSGNFTVSNLDLSRSGATGPQIFVDTAQSITVTDTNLTFSAPAASSDSREALHLYRVGSANVSRLTVTNSDVGFKATTEMGTSTKILVSDSTITNARTAAVMLESWDATAFGTVKITGNDLKGAPAGYSIWQVGSTALGTGSLTTGNTQ